jgi:xanthine/uracil/vitamin C permease (AzgA family)
MRRTELTVTKSIAMRYVKRVSLKPLANLNMLLTEPEVRRDLIMATSAIAALSSILFGLSTNLPIALA